MARRKEPVIPDAVLDQLLAGSECGNLSRTAIRLGIAKSTLYEKMKRYGIERPGA